MLERIRFALLKKKIKKNPYLGKEDIGGVYAYKEGGYAIKYRVLKEAPGKESVEWISEKCRLSPYEETIRKVKNNASNFWHYQGWLVFFRAPVILLLLASAFLLYFGLLETQEAKAKRFNWIISRAIGVSPGQIEYIGSGWLEISTQREAAVDRINEPVKYTINPFKWFFSSKAGFVTRWRGEQYGYVTHPVAYNERGEVWIKKEGIWRQGQISGKTVKWDIPQGTGIRAGKVVSHEISIRDKKLQVIDK